MIIDVSSADVVTVYQALVGVVTPRPIAWVTTVDDQGRVNLAPFSFFNAFGANPPVVVFSPTLRRDGSKKDTLLNLEAVPEFVLNAAVEDLAEKMNATAKELPHGQSEATYAGLTLQPSAKVRPPRVAESPVHMECRMRQIMSIGDGPDRGQPRHRRSAPAPHRRRGARLLRPRRSSQAPDDRPPRR